MGGVRPVIFPDGEIWGWTLIDDDKDEVWRHGTAPTREWAERDAAELTALRLRSRSVPRFDMERLEATR